jgi:hypothetical protein
MAYRRLGKAHYAGKPEPVRVSYAINSNGAVTGPSDNLPSLEGGWPGWARGDLPQFLHQAPAPTGTWTFYLDDNSMSDLFLTVTWGSQPPASRAGPHGGEPQEFADHNCPHQCR